MSDTLDVVIVGGGPAGLSAALTLGRCRRTVLVFDSGTPRNWAAREMHGFLTRDGIPPDELRDLARKELERYPSVAVKDVRVSDIEPSGSGFVVSAGERTKVSCRKVLLATGLVDDLPEIADIERYFGISVFQCPYCDGWEMRDEPVAVYGCGKRAFQMARAMTAWTKDIIVITDGASELTKVQEEQLSNNGIGIEPARVTRLAGKKGFLSAICLAGGQRIARKAMFFDTDCFQQSDLAARLGCSFTKKGGVACGRYEATGVKGVYVAGNLIKNVHLAIVAAAEGAKAGMGINKALTREDFKISR